MGNFLLLIIIAALFFLGITSISYQQEVFSLFVFMGLFILLFVNKRKTIRYNTTVIVSNRFCDIYGF